MLAASVFGRNRLAFGNVQAENQRKTLPIFEGFTTRGLTSRPSPFSAENLPLAMPVSTTTLRHDLY
jgi:hypothetical protein